MFSIGIHPTSVKEEKNRLIGFIHCKLIELLTAQGFLMVQGLTANGVTVRWWPVFRKKPFRAVHCPSFNEEIFSCYDQTYLVHREAAKLAAIPCLYALFHFRRSRYPVWSQNNYTGAFQDGSVRLDSLWKRGCLCTSGLECVV